MGRKYRREVVSRDELRSQEIELGICKAQLMGKISFPDYEDDPIPDERFRIYSDDIWIRYSYCNQWLNSAIGLWDMQDEAYRYCANAMSNGQSKEQLIEGILRILSNV